MPRFETLRRLAFSYKVFTALAGIGLFVLAFAFGANEINYLTQVSGSPPLVDAILIIAIVAVILSATALASSLPNSLKTRFHRPKFRQKSNFQYGFGTVLAVGIGATLGSPLFILIPLNIIQFELISIISLVLATVLSVLMAKVYANMYIISKSENLGALGGPSFTKIAAGTRSLRYFLARLSMFIANTALAAYSAIIFVLFDFQYIPTILAAYGMVGTSAQVVKYGIAASFALWFILNSFFERRLLRLIGAAQVVLTWVMMAILVSQDVLMGSSTSWNIAGILSLHSSGYFNLVSALVTNTAFLYLLFFGFQEIQILEHDSLEKSSIPIVSWIKKGYKMEKTRYFGLAMISSVVIAACVNIFYAVSVYSVHPSYAQLSAQHIPALFLSKLILGNNQETLMSIAFLIATFTTFVPAFMAATRHLASLAEDGFMPHSVSGVAWLFVLVSIALLAVSGESFLVSITDFMVLISLGLISFSAIWMRKGKPLRTAEVLPLIVGVSCLVAAGGIYFIQSSVAVFGSLAIAVVYLIYDIFELGDFGVQLFLALFDIVAFIALEVYPHVPFVKSFPFFDFLLPVSNDINILGEILIVSSVLLFANLGIDFFLKQSATQQVARLKRAEI